MYGLTDDMVDMREEIKVLNQKVSDLKTLTRLLLDDPTNKTVQNAVRIALDQFGPDKD